MPLLVNDSVDVCEYKNIPGVGIRVCLCDSECWRACRIQILSCSIDLLCICGECLSQWQYIYVPVPDNLKGLRTCTIQDFLSSYRLTNLNNLTDIHSDVERRRDKQT